jgi:hypothetical protein
MGKRMHWQYCQLCSKPVIYHADAFEMQEHIWKELADRMEEHQLNLCRKCLKDFGVCDGKPEFGDCVGADNVINCSAHDESERARW